MARTPDKLVSATELRKMFNDGKYWEKVKSGVLRTKIIKDSHPSASPAGEPHCTRSQYITYIDKRGKVVAGVHQFLRTDGTIGASGRPDPKRLYINGIVYAC